MFLADLRNRTKIVSALLLIIILSLEPVYTYAKEDFVLEGVYEAALDLPRIYFVLKRQANGTPLGQTDEAELNYAFLDTGASGVLISKETASLMGIKVDAKAQFVDVGVGGQEYFSVSEPLYVCVAGFGMVEPQNINMYKCLGNGRFQIKNSEAGLLGEPVDVIGMPAMVDKIVVLNSGATNNLEYFAADIKKQGDAGIPKADIEVRIRLKKFTNPKDPENIPPLPVSADNPVIDDIVINHKGKSSKGTWLFDTGATISLISTKQASRLGLVSEDGSEIIKPVFSLPIGGVGNMTQVKGYEIDTLKVPTMSGFNIVFKKVRIGVRDISYPDKDNNECVLDGVFGSNFLCSSAKMDELLPSDVSKTIFNYIVIDMQKGILGFDVEPNQKLP